MGRPHALVVGGTGMLRAAVLGFVREKGRSRWLTDGEISRGVLHAVAATRPRTVVGTVEPWSARP